MHRGNGVGYSSQHNSQESSGTFGDIDSFVDFDMFPFSSSGATSQNSSSTNLSRTASNQPSIQPSFPYDLYPQTVPPVLSADYHVPEVTSGASSSITMSPDLLDMDLQLNAMMPPFFFPEASGGTVDPATILGANTITPDMGTEYKYIPQPPPQFDGKRLYAGIHTQRAAYNKDLEQRRMMEQAKKNASAPVVQSEMTIDQRIDAVLNRMKPTKIVPSATSPSQTLPHIARMKKDEEEMDEDERLLASEEGKKLSSKERRQLRNKVSARAFRSRRKEYIGQLEAEVANKTSEAAELRAENSTLKSELQQLQEFTRSVLRSPAFSSFLAELEKAQTAASAPAQPAEPTPAPVPEPQSNYHKDPNPHMLNVGNDDWAMAYGPVAGAPMWAINTQVYAVTHVPEGPVNLQHLTGKPIRPRTEDFIDWSSFPPPVDGFSPNYAEKTSLAPITEGDCEMYDVEEDQTSYIMPDNLEDLVAAKEGNISDRIEKLAPGVGLNSLLGTLEAVINGEVDVKKAFSLAGEAVDKLEATETPAEEDTPEYRQRCRDVARMFDVMESFKRVGDIIGRS